MAPVRWTTPEQATFLNQWLSKYEEHSGQDYEKFWTSIFPAWFKEWPIEGDGPAIAARKLQLKTWFRWRTSASRRNRQQKRTTSVFDKAIEPKGSRVLSLAELYSIQYYEEHIKPRIKADQEAGMLTTRGEVLAASRRLARELFEAEDDAVKQEIQDLYQKQKTRSESADSEAPELTDPYELQRSIDDLPYALARVAELIRRRTGFVVSFMCAGPDPSRNWEITSLSCHPDQTPQGHSFPTLFPRQENDMLSAFQDYAEALFPPDMRDPSTRGVENDEDASGTEDLDQEDEINVVYPPMGGDDVELEEGNEENGEVGPDDLGEDMGESLGDASFLSAEHFLSAESVSAERSTLSSNASSSGISVPQFCISAESVISAERSTLPSRASSVSGISVPQSPSFDPYFDLGGIDLGPHANTASFQMPPGLAQSSTPFTSYGNSSSFTQQGPISFTGATNNPNLAGCGWNFTGIGLESLPCFNTMDLAAGTIPDGDPLLPPLPPPILSQDSPTRPRLPAVPPPSPPHVAETGKVTHPKKGKGKRPAIPASKPTAMPVASTVLKTSKAKRRNAEVSLADSSTASNTPADLGAPLPVGTTVASTVPKAKRGNASAGTAIRTTAPQLASTTESLQDLTHPPPSVPSGPSQPGPSQRGGASPPASRASKRVPVQSKRNMLADAIGTNQQTFVGGVNGNQQVHSPKRKGKRAAAETTQGLATKKKKSKELSQ